MSHFLLYSAIIVLLISKVALILYLVLFFYGKHLRESEEDKLYTQRQVRKIILPKRDKMTIREEIASYVLRLRTLRWTVCIGELIGYIFLALSSNRAGYTVIGSNAIILYLTAFLCQLMTLVDAWFKKKSDITIRLGFQLAMIALASVSLKIADGNGLIDVKKVIFIIILLFFSSAVIAIYSMLIEGIFNQEKYPPYDFNNYSRVVIASGIVIGGSLTLLSPFLIG